MSKRTAVLCIYLVTAATAIAAIILPQAGSSFVAVLVFAQTVLILGVVALLEQHPMPVAAAMAMAEPITQSPRPDAHGEQKKSTPTDGAPIHTEPVR